MRMIPLTAVAFAMVVTPALAQDQSATTIQIAESDEFGQYLATGDDRPVYLFTTDTQGTGDQQAQITCTSEDCLNAWPLVTTEGDPQAGDEVGADMLDTIEYEGQTVVTYNGWPLYYFVRDQNADAPQGQEVGSFGGEWYLVTPEGDELHAE